MEVLLDLINGYDFTLVYKMVLLTMGHEQKQWNNKFFFNEF
jgi:hypothetical protein